MNSVISFVISKWLLLELSIPAVGQKDRRLWEREWASHDSRTFRHCVSSESSLTNLIVSGLNLLCLQIHSGRESQWTYPEVAILAADQKKCGLWEREYAFFGETKRQPEIRLRSHNVLLRRCRLLNSKIFMAKLANSTRNRVTETLRDTLVSNEILARVSGRQNNASHVKWR